MTSEELREKFQVPFSEFSSPVEWTDDIGFSVTESDTNNRASMYKIGLSSRDNGEDAHLKELWLSATYGEVTSAGIRLRESRNLNEPVDLDVYKDFFYDERNDHFYYKDEIIEPKQILVKLRNAHRLPTKPFKGFPIRTKLWFWRIVLPAIINSIDWIFIISLLLVSGEKTEKNIIRRRIEERSDARISNTPTQSNSINFQDSKKINFFGYEAKRWSVIFYCIVHLLGYLIILLFNINHGYFIIIGKSSFLSLCYVVVTFAIVESGIPAILRSLIKSMTKIYTNVAFKTIKVSP